MRLVPVRDNEFTHGERPKFCWWAEVSDSCFGTAWTVHVREEGEVGESFSIICSGHLTRLRANNGIDFDGTQVEIIETHRATAAEFYLQFGTVEPGWSAVVDVEAIRP